jgi:uncharacterized ion transporter superfamily protein YfcC
MDMITPTNGGLMAVLAAAAGVGCDEWLRFARPLMALITALGAVAVVFALAIGLQ